MPEDSIETTPLDSTENQTSPEQNVRNHQTAFTTSVMCREWYPGELRGNKDTDKIRGDLALQTLQAASVNGFQVVAVVDKESKDFAKELKEKGITVYDDEQNSLSGSRRQAIQIAKSLDGVKTIVTSEPEKLAVVESLQKLTQPILDGETDIAIPRRDEKAFEIYPPEQAEQEKRANRIANRFLRQEKLLSADSPDLDFWVGVRAFRNDPEIIELFMEENLYSFDENARKVIEEKKIDPQIFDLDSWANALYIPVVKAMRQGLRVKGVDIPYSHPSLQTQDEIGDPAFDKKRLLQLKNIILAMVQAKSANAPGNEHINISTKKQKPS